MTRSSFYKAVSNLTQELIEELLIVRKTQTLTRITAQRLVYDDETSSESHWI